LLQDRKLFKKLRFTQNKLVNLTESEIKWLCVKAKDVMINQPVFLELTSPIIVCGKLYFLSYKVTHTVNIMTY